MRGDLCPDVPVRTEYRVRWAGAAWEVEQAMQLRQAVFCHEQRIFAGDDRDEIDDVAQLLVAVKCEADAPQAVVGTVRIHQAEPGLWFGSRLAVHTAYRSQGGIGATLIKLAVSSAHALGCTRFLAHVQSQNVPLFRRLRWHVLTEETLLGRPHHLMQASLAHYPPCHTPQLGFVVPDRSA